MAAPMRNHEAADWVLIHPPSLSGVNEHDESVHDGEELGYVQYFKYGSSHVKPVSSVPRQIDIQIFKFNHTFWGFVLKPNFQKCQTFQVYSMSESSW